MRMRRISFALICSGILLVLGWAAFRWTRTPATTAPGPVAAVTPTPAVADPGADKDKESLEQGKELFTHEWSAGDRLSTAGDGLGPVYNAQSCAACHKLGGIGGAGNNETNVSLVTVFVGAVSDGPFSIDGVISGLPAVQEPSLSLADARKKVVVTKPDGKVELEIPSADELAKIHPALRTQTSFPLHRFGIGPEFAEWKASIFPKDKTETERVGRRKQDSNRRHIMSVGSRLC